MKKKRFKFLYRQLSATELDCHWPSHDPLIPCTVGMLYLMSYRRLHTPQRWDENTDGWVHHNRTIIFINLHSNMVNIGLPTARWYLPGGVVWGRERVVSTVNCCHVMPWGTREGECQSIVRSRADDSGWLGAIGDRNCDAPVGTRGRKYTVFRDFLRWPSRRHYPWNVRLWFMNIYLTDITHASVVSDQIIKQLRRSWRKFLRCLQTINHTVTIPEGDCTGLRTSRGHFFFTFSFFLEPLLFVSAVHGD